MFLNLLTSGDKSQGSNPLSLVVMLALVVGIIALFIWTSISNKKKRKQAQEALESIKIGDRVKTIGGVCGFIVQINDDENTFVLETGLEETKSYIKFDKQAIYQTAPANGNKAEAKEYKEDKDYKGTKEDKED